MAKICKHDHAEQFSPCLETVSVVSLCPAAECQCVWPMVQPLLTGSWVRCLLIAEVQSCSSVWVWSVTAPPHPPRSAGALSLPNDYVLACWLKLLCLAVWRTPWKVQHHVFGDSHNETFLWLICSELMAFPVLDGGNSRPWSNWGCVCHTSHCFTSMTPSWSNYYRLRLIHSRNEF